MRKNDVELIVTACQCFTIEQAEKHLKGKISLLNWEILMAHITEPELACYIHGFLKENGVLYLFTEDGTYRVNHTNNNTIKI